jgi:hypothetical protein
MGALTLVQIGLPPARARLVAINEKIVAAEKQLRTLRAGEAALASELGRAAEAKAELQELVNVDAVRLLDRLRSGGQWMLSAFGNERAKELAASLSESRIQAAVGEKALASIGEEIAVIEREIADMKAGKQSAILAVMKEASAGYREDLSSVIEDLRQALVILGALDLVTAQPTGEWTPHRRIVVTVPSVAGLPEKVVACPYSCIESAGSIWRAWAEELAADPLSTVESLQFPHVSGAEDNGKILYHELERAERLAVDLAHAQGVK